AGIARWARAAGVTARGVGALRQRIAHRRLLHAFVDVHAARAAAARKARGAFAGIADAVAIGVRLRERGRIAVLLLRIALARVGIAGPRRAPSRARRVVRDLLRRILDVRAVVEPIEHAVAVLVDRAGLDAEANRQRAAAHQRHERRAIHPVRLRLRAD